MSDHVALLRGINVGGKNLIKMADLAACFAELGFVDVATYIQSGNVLFRPPARSARAALVARIEAALAARFAYRAVVVVRSRKELAATIAAAPAGFGAEPRRFRYDVMFLRPAVSAAAALPQVPTRPGVDQVWVGPGALYTARLIRRATQSRISRLTQLPLYQDLTIRNWNTTTALLRLMGGVAQRV